MAAATASAPNRSRRLAALPSLLDANRRPPPSCEGLVPRTRLIRYLLDARDVPLVLMVAPAGYGKTTVVSQWARRDKRPFVWLTLDADANDPVQLLASISRALETLEPNRSFVLVIDGVHVLRERASFEILTAFVEELPWASQLALTSRSEPAMPVGRLRAHRKVVELRPRDLVMAPSEAAVLLSATGLNLGGGVVEALVRRTEGWAAGLYLAALSLRKRADLGVAVEQFSGDDALVADYLRDEILSGL